MTALSQIFTAVFKAIKMLFGSDLDVVSPEAKEILSNPEDRQKYLKAIESLRNRPGEKETIILSTKEELTLVS